MSADIATIVTGRLRASATIHIGNYSAEIRGRLQSLGREFLIPLNTFVRLQVISGERQAKGPINGGNAGNISGINLLKKPFLENCYTDLGRGRYEQIVPVTLTEKFCRFRK
jgi:hypothetical protein